MIPCLATVLVFDWQLAQSDGGWTAQGSLGQWEYGNEAVAGYSGTMWATRLGAPTLNDSVELLELDLPPIESLQRPVLLLDHHHELGAGDVGVVEVDRGQGFVVLDPIHGYPNVQGYTGLSAGFHEVGFDLSDLSDGSRVRLRFEADAAGAGPGWFVRGARLVDGDPVSARVDLVAAPSDTQDLDGPHAVTVRVLEDVQVVSATLSWAAGGSVGEIPLVDAGSGQYTAVIPPTEVGQSVSWSVQVQDCASVTSLSGDPYRIFLAAPSGLQGPVGPHAVATSATLSWTPPVSPHPVLGYHVTELGTGTTTSAASTSVDVLLDPVFQDYVVRAVYDVDLGDASEVLTLDVEVPELIGVRPAAGWPGDRVYVEVDGHALYLLDEVSALALGDGVSVESFEVRDVNRGVAVVSVAADATPGPRTLLVSGAQGAFTFPDAFAVLDAATAPRIVSVEPEGVVQGDEITLEIRANVAFAGPVTVTADDELIPTVEAVVHGDRVVLGLAATGRSRPGVHTLVLDDGERLWSAQVEVLEYRLPSARTCAATGTPGVWWILALTVSAWRRRSS